MPEDSSRGAGSVGRSIGWIVLLLALAATVGAGLKIRREAWTYTQGAHFKGDINNAFQWGRLADEHGLFRLYDDDEAANPTGAEAAHDAVFQLAGRKTDYPPLRLTIALTWYRWAHRQFPDAQRWNDDYNFTWPLLWVNTIAELISAGLVFLIIVRWRNRQVLADNFNPVGWPWKNRGACLSAGFGALLLWFNPAVIWDGHCWPQWDIWPVPFFLAALLLASLDWWMAAGFLLAIGASLKGQMLLGAPILLLWPIFRGRFDAALKLVSGFVLVSALIALPWMHPTPAGIRWLTTMWILLVMLSPLANAPRPKDWRVDVALILVAMLLAWPWGAVSVAPPMVWLGLGMAAMAVFLRHFPSGVRWAAIGLFAGAAIFLLMPFFGASAAWYRLGFIYGTEKFDFMVTGSGAYNVPRMLMVYTHWPDATMDLVYLPFLDRSITFTTMTRLVYGFCLLLCGIGAAMQDRRRDSRFLAAMVAPWLLFFVILTQMHGRYTIWAAALGALLAGVSTGMALLGVVVSVVSWMGIAENQMMFAPHWSPVLLARTERLDPAVGFLLVLIAAILLYTAIVPGRRMGGNAGSVRQQ